MQRTDIQDITSIVRTLLDKRVTVIRDDSFPTCAWSFEQHTVIMSNQVVPEVLRGTKIEGHLLAGAALHECGHPMFSGATIELITAKENSVKNKQLMHDAINIITDSTINYRMAVDWSHTVGSSLSLLMKLSGEAIIEDIRESVKKGEDVDPILLMVAIGLGLVNISTVKDLLDKLSKTQKRLVIEGVGVIFTAKTAVSWETQNALFDRMYQILTKLLSSQNKSGGNGAGDSIPNQMGGRYVVRGGDKTKAAAEREMQSSSSDGDSESESGDSGDEESKSEGAGKGGDDKRHRSVGYDPNAVAKTPDANPKAFYEAVERNQKPIKEILDRLKQLVSSKVVMEQYLERGRVMPQMLARASIQRYPPRDIYSKFKIEPEPDPTRWSIVVDLSGSMNVREAIDALVIFSEVASQYLKDDEFAIYAFGSGWVKIKSMYESYENVKTRIGGLTGLGGTVLGGCLEAVEKELVSMINGHRNRVIIVTDFELFGKDVTISKEICKMLLDIPRTKIIPLDFGYGSQPLSKHLDARLIDSIAEMPEIFIDAYLQDMT